MGPTPKTFFRYQAFNLKTLDSLCHDTLHFALPTQFNDPFDSQPTLDCDSSILELRTLLEKLILHRAATEIRGSLARANLRDDKANTYASRHARKEAEEALAEIAYQATNPDYEEGAERAEEWLLTQELESELLRHYYRGVCCFSADYKNPLLWSHYADHHRGLCVGYTTDRAPKPHLRRVVYGGGRSIKTSLVVAAFCGKDLTAQKSLERNVLLRKAKEWTYEREWRLIGRNGLNDSPLLMTEITFGLRCPEAVRHAVVKSLSDRRKAIRFYDVYRTRKNYSLRRRALDTEDLSRYLPKVAESGVEMFGSG